MTANTKRYVCFLGSSRYTVPLDATQAKKWRSLSALGTLFVIAFAVRGGRWRNQEHASFYLLPDSRWRIVRQAGYLLAATAIACFLVLRRRVTILVAQSPYEALAGVIVKTVGQLTGRKLCLIVESHGDLQESVFLERKVWLPRAYRHLRSFLVWFVLKRCDALRAISVSTESQLRALAPGRLCVRFGTWTDIDVFLQAGKGRGARATQDVIHVGVITPLKGVQFLLEAFIGIAGELPLSRLWILGREENKSFAAALRQRSQECQLGDRIIFRAPVAQADLAEILTQVAVLVLASQSEGLGRVILEAMAAGTPVIATAVGGIVDLVQDGVTGFLVPPADVNALKERLLWVLNNEEAARTIATMAREYAAKFFSTEAYVDGYRRLFALTGPS